MQDKLVWSLWWTHGCLFKRCHGLSDFGSVMIVIWEIIVRCLVLSFWAWLYFQRGCKTDIVLFCLLALNLCVHVYEGMCVFALLCECRMRLGSCEVKPTSQIQEQETYFDSSVLLLHKRVFVPKEGGDFSVHNMCSTGMWDAYVVVLALFTSAVGW